MSNHKEDIIHKLGFLFLMILFSLFMLVLADKTESYNTIPQGSATQAELALVNISAQPGTFVLNAVSIPDLYQEGLNALHYTGNKLCSLNYILSHYNHCTSGHFRDSQKTRLQIKPLFLWQLDHPVFPGKSDDSPVLS